MILPSTPCVPVLQELSDSYWRVSRGHEHQLMGASICIFPASCAQVVHVGLLENSRLDQPQVQAGLSGR